MAKVELVLIIFLLAMYIGLGYVCLFILVIPHSWFEVYMEKSFALKIENSYLTLENQKETKRKMSALIEKALTWLLTWGIFLAIEALLAWNLYRGFIFVTDFVGTFASRLTVE